MKDSFQEFTLKLNQIAEKNKDLQDKLGDIPDEFLCPISCDIMRDPVMLPSSCISIFNIRNYLW